MIEDFVNFELTKKLKEKGFSCEYPFAMCDESGNFFFLTTSAYYYCDYKCTNVNDFICPTIHQVLKWLREEKKIHISPVLWSNGWYIDIQSFTKEIDKDGVAYKDKFEFQSIDYETYEEACIAGIEYVLNNLI